MPHEEFGRVPTDAHLCSEHICASARRSRLPCCCHAEGVKAQRQKREPQTIYSETERIAVFAGRSLRGIVHGFIREYPLGMEARCRDRAADEENPHRYEDSRQRGTACQPSGGHPPQPNGQNGCPFDSGFSPPVWARHLTTVAVPRGI